MAKIGYARVSTPDQSFNLQLNALKAEGCTAIYTETATGAKTDRPILNDVLDNLSTEDILVVWRLDRVGRSLSDLIVLMKRLENQGVSLKSLQDPIDTSTPQGRLVFNIFSSLAEFERELIRERTMAGLKSARARGRKGGRKKGLSEKAKSVALAARTLYHKQEMTGYEISDKLGISRATLYRYLKADLS